MDKNVSGSKLKSNIVEGIRVGLMAFVICFVISFLLSILCNFTIMKFLKDAMQGAITDSGATQFGMIVKLTSVILSFSVFSSLGVIKIGVLFFAIIPFLAFFIAENRDLRKGGVTYWNLITYLVSSFIFSSVLSLLMIFTRGELLGLDISFASVKNWFVTIIVILVIQLIIGLNYNKQASSYIKATRMLFWMVFGIGTVLALVGLIKLMASVPLNLIGKVGAIIVLLPNFLVYKGFLLMGNNIKTSSELSEWMDQVASLQISFQQLSVLASLIAIVGWIVIVVISLLFINKSKYWSEMGLFALTFSVIAVFLAFCTSTSLGTVMFVGEVFIGISLLQAFFVPLVSIGALGVVVWIVRKMISVAKDI